jgi:hypothetical protein
VLGDTSIEKDAKEKVGAVELFTFESSISILLERNMAEPR